MKTYGLIGLILGLVIVGILVYRAGKLYTRGSEESRYAVAPPERANILSCQMRIKKIEDAIQIYYAESGKYPESLDDLRDIPSTEKYCPITGQVYYYSPLTGRVACSHGN
ncbi:MAG: hypothetical protein N3A65_08870 [candidate division WOR-3 bacterium]|nr:hypothetical protein [candidate division WOR-3 bacterium]